MGASTDVTSERVSEQKSFLRKHWWLLSLVVLIALVMIIYLLSHLSAADSEMYPTTMLCVQRAVLRLC